MIVVEYFSKVLIKTKLIIISIQYFFWGIVLQLTSSEFYYEVKISTDDDLKNSLIKGLQRFTEKSFFMNREKVIFLSINFGWGEHCVKRVRSPGFCGTYFLVFELNTETYRV